MQPGAQLTRSFNVVSKNLSVTPDRCNALDRMDDDALLDMLGPSWYAMSYDERQAYPSPVAIPDREDVAA